MADLRERFGVTDLIPDPDLWPEVEERLARRAPGPTALVSASRRPASDRVRRIVTIAAAFAIGVASTLVAIRALRPVKTPNSGADRSFGVFAPARGWIVFARGSDIVAVDPTGDPERPPIVLLHLAEGGSVDPVGWSPDGRSLLIVRREKGRSTGSVINPDGSETGLGSVVSGGLPLAWSPDGTRIAITTSRGIMEVTPDGRGRSLLVPNGATSVGAPTWSPDGRRLAYWGGDGERFAISEIDLSTGQRREIVEIPSSPRWRDLYGLQWSPDGSRFLFGGCPMSQGGRWTCDVYVVGSDGTGFRSIENPARTDDWPAWSPSGARIVFGVFGHRGIYVMDDDGSDRRLVSLTGRGPFAWNPA